MVTGRASLEEACHAMSGPSQSGVDRAVPAISAIAATKQSSHLTTTRLQTIAYPLCTCRRSALWQKTNARLMGAVRLCHRCFVLLLASMSLHSSIWTAVFANDVLARRLVSGCDTSSALSAIKRALVMSYGPARPDGLALASAGLAVSRSATTRSGVWLLSS